MAPGDHLGKSSSGDNTQIEGKRFSAGCRSNGYVKKENAVSCWFFVH